MKIRDLAKLLCQREGLKVEVSIANMYEILGHLADIIFEDMEIDHEILPEHGNKRGFVRELLAFTGRIGRLQELIQVCQAERPSIEW